MDGRKEAGRRDERRGERRRREKGKYGGNERMKECEAEGRNGGEKNRGREGMRPVAFNPLPGMGEQAYYTTSLAFSRVLVEEMLSSTCSIFQKLGTFNAK